MYNEFFYGFKTWFQRVREKIMNQATNKYRSFRKKAVNSSNENAQQLKGKFTIRWLSGRWVAMIATSFPTFPSWRQPRFGASVYNFTASPFNSDYVQMFHLVFHDGNQQSYHNSRKWHSILPSFQRTLYSRKKPENKTFSKTSILPTRCFKQFFALRV